MPIAGVGKLKPSFPFRSPLQRAVTVVPTDGFKSYSSPTKRDYELSKAQNVTHEGSWQRYHCKIMLFSQGVPGRLVLANMTMIACGLTRVKWI